MARGKYMRRRRTVEFKPDQPKVVKRQRWEYWVTQVDGLEAWNEIGESGWEMFFITQDDYGKRTIWFKRKRLL